MIGGIAGEQVGCEVLLGVLVAAYAAGLWWFGRGVRSQPHGHPALPLVSVVVAARDEAHRIGELLGDLARQDYPAAQWELIVVDDGSRDGTAECCRIAWRGAPPLRVLPAEGRGKKAALAQGIAAARGGIILSTDADCRVPATWVGGMAGCFGPGVQLVVGFSQIGWPGQVGGLRQGLEGLDFLHLMGAALGSAGQGVALAASGQNLAFRAEIFAAVGGYRQVAHRASGDDVLLLQLVRRRAPEGIRFSTHPSTYVVHPPAPSWAALLAQRARWASNAPYQLLLNPGFFAYISLVFGTNLFLAASPLLGPLGVVRPEVLLGAWLAKVGTEGLFCWRVTAFFGRCELRRFFLPWAVLQPFYLLVAGVLGTLGIFTWKGRKHRWGRRRLKP